MNDILKWLAYLSLLYFVLFTIIPFVRRATFFPFKLTYSYIRAKYIVNNLSSGAVCYVLSQVGHPDYGGRQEMCAGGAPHIWKLGRRPNNKDLIVAVQSTLLGGYATKEDYLKQVK